MIRLDAHRSTMIAWLALAGAVAAVLTWDALRPVGYAIIAVIAVVALALLVAVNGRTMGERWSDRRRFARRLSRRRPSTLYSTNRVGVAWDGESVSMFVAFSAKPWQISVIDRPDPILPEPVPMDLLTNYLVQGDISCERLKVGQMGYRRFARNAFTGVYEGDVGDLPLPTSMTTVIEVTVNLDKSMAAVLRRNIAHSVPAALGSTVSLVASRLSRALNVEGYEARLLTSREIEWRHQSMLAWSNSGLLDEHRTHLGGKMPVAVSRPREWTPSASEKWWSVPSDRMASVFVLESGRFSTITTHAQLAYAYPSAEKFPDKAHSLTRAIQAQGDSMTEMLPLAVDDNPSANRRPLAPGEEYPVTVYGAGLGMYLGVTDDGGRAFVNLQTGGEVLWVHAPAQFVASFAARASAVGANVGLHLDGQGWVDLCERVNPTQMKVKPAKRQSVEFYRDVPPSSVLDATAVVVWCPKQLPSRTTFSLVMDRQGNATISTPDGEVTFRWNPSAEEMAFLPAAAPRAPANAAATSE
ncbi:hypothetical protein [Gordonia malaquae]|uniref:hypothetical protein n=1 Tax=Gordonia malaquae TaxID=410332 RepID=UPI003017852C